MDCVEAILETLRSDGSIIVNKKLAKEIGINEAIMYSELISKYLYFRKNNMLENGYFYNTIENMQEDTSLTETLQSKAIKKLLSLELIDYKRKGIPAKRYFKINHNNIIIDILSRNKFLKVMETGYDKYWKQESDNNGGNNTNINNTNINNTNYNISHMDNHMEEVKEIFEYWKKIMKHKRAKFSGDRIIKIKARLKEGFTVAECKKAIDGCANSSYHMGNNDDKKKYDSIDLIFRKADKLEWFINNNHKPKGHIRSIKQQAEEIAKRWDKEDREKEMESNQSDTMEKEVVW